MPWRELAQELWGRRSWRVCGVHNLPGWVGSCFFLHSLEQFSLLKKFRSFTFRRYCWRRTGSHFVQYICYGFFCKPEVFFTICPLFKPWNPMALWTSLILGGGKSTGGSQQMKVIFSESASAIPAAISLRSVLSMEMPFAQNVRLAHMRTTCTCL